MKKNENKFKKLIKKFFPVLLLTTLVGVVCFFIGKKIGLNTDTQSTNKTIEDVAVEKQTIKKTLTATGQIESSETEKISLNTSYYFDSLYVEEDDIVKKGEKILKYTNGKYLTAPYDLVITKINTPDKGSKATSSNYIQVSNMSNLIVTIDVNESEISNIEEGQEVDIALNADSSKKYTGKINKISSVGTYSSSGTTFPVSVSIENDGDIKIGMSVSCTISIEKKEDVLAVPVSAVQINGDRRYVIVVDGKDTKEVDVTTGLSDDTYVEIKSGLNEGETVRVVTVTKQSTIRSSSSSSRSKSGFPGSGSMPGGGSSSRPSFNGEMPDMSNFKPNN